MSLSLLLTPNNLGPFFMGTITIAALNTTTINTQSLTASPSFGTFNLQNAFSITLPKGINQLPYIIFSSGIETIKDVNLSGAVSTGIAHVRFRRIGNWVDVYVYYNITSVGVTNTDAIKLVGALDVGYRPTSGNVSFIIQVIDTGVSPNTVAGTAQIDASGDIEIRRLGPVNWTGGADWGFNSFSYSFTIQ